MMPLQVDRRWLWNARQRLNDVILLGRIQHQTADVAKHFDFQDLPRFKILIDIDWHMRPLFITRYQNFSQNHFSPQVFKAKDDLAFSKLRVSTPDKAFADFHLFPFGKSTLNKLPEAIAARSSHAPRLPQRADWDRS